MQHHTPHFHAYYQNEAGVFSIEPVELIAGDLPRKQRRLVEAWAELHEEELQIGTSFNLEDCLIQYNH